MSYSVVALADLDTTTIENWRATGIVYLVGSYVSIFPPTDLPPGWHMTQALWQRIFRKSDLAFFQNGSNNPAFDQNGSDLDAVPFEAIMQHYPKRSEVRRIIANLFGSKEPNAIHRCLYFSLQSGVAKGLITTNYDLAFDSLVSGDPDCIRVFDEPSCDEYWRLRSGSRSSPAAYFKIHGTAEVENTIVCDLENESWPPKWKRDLLFDLTKNRTLIVLGYSGRDFDVCPDLADYTKQAQTVWLQPGGMPTDNARRVLNSHKGIVVDGDLVDFLRILLDRSLTVSPPSRATICLDAFDPGCTGEWRLNVLDWIACSTLLFESFAELADKPALRRALYGHSGRYRDALQEFEAEAHSISAPTEQRLRNEIQLVSARFIYGQHTRSWRALGRIDKQISSTPKCTDDLRALAAEARVVMYMRAAQLARMFRLNIVLRQIQRKAGPLYVCAKKVLQELGAWGRLEALQQNAERIGIASLEGLPMPARRGYRSLGLVSMDSIVKRDWIRSGCWRLGAEKQEFTKKCIAKAEHYGWHHEAWKLNWMMLWRGAGEKASYFRCWLKHFRVTQYPRAAGFVQLLLNLIPTGPEHDFEQEQYWIRFKSPK